MFAERALPLVWSSNGAMSEEIQTAPSGSERVPIANTAVKQLKRCADNARNMGSRFEAAAHFSTSAGARGVRRITYADDFDRGICI
jgi:hypothetical protein